MKGTRAAGAPGLHACHPCPQVLNSKPRGPTCFPPHQQLHIKAISTSCRFRQPAVNPESLSSPPTPDPPPSSPSSQLAFSCPLIHSTQPQLVHKTRTRSMHSNSTVPSHPTQNEVHLPAMPTSACFCSSFPDLHTGMVFQPRDHTPSLLSQTSQIHPPPPFLRLCELLFTMPFSHIVPSHHSCLGLNVPSL